jgi:LysM repeat protein
LFVGGAVIGALSLTWLASASAASATPSPTYTVVSGDTLWAIGLSHHTTWQALASYNQIPNPNLILTGQVLKLPPPGWQPPSAAAAPTSQSSEAQETPAPQPLPVYHQPAPVVYAAPGGIWGCIALYESGGNPSTNTGNGYYGMYQDTLGSWQAAGGPPGLPSDYSAGVQTAVNQRIQAQQGWSAWPNTSVRCGA